jgi:hypothetical protein
MQRSADSIFDRLDGHDRELDRVVAREKRAAGPGVARAPNKGWATGGSAQDWSGQEGLPSDQASAALWRPWPSSRPSAWRTFRASRLVTRLHARDLRQAAPGEEDLHATDLAKGLPDRTLWWRLGKADSRPVSEAARVPAAVPEPRRDAGPAGHGTEQHGLSALDARPLHPDRGVPVLPRAGDVRRVMSLQRLAGNAAVATLLQRQASDSPGDPPEALDARRILAQWHAAGPDFPSDFVMDRGRDRRYLEIVRRVHDVAVRMLADELAKGQPDPARVVGALGLADLLRAEAERTRGAVAGPDLVALSEDVYRRARAMDAGRKAAAPPAAPQQASPGAQSPGGPANGKTPVSLKDLWKSVQRTGSQYHQNVQLLFLAWSASEVGEGAKTALNFNMMNTEYNVGEKAPAYASHVTSGVTTPENARKRYDPHLGPVFDWDPKQKNPAVRTYPYDPKYPKEAWDARTIDGQLDTLSSRHSRMIIVAWTNRHRPAFPDLDSGVSYAIRWFGRSVAKAMATPRRRSLAEKALAGDVDAAVRLIEGDRGDPRWNGAGASYRRSLLAKYSEMSRKLASGELDDKSLRLPPPG